MGDGKLSDRDLARCLAETEHVPGDYAEAGVYRGHLFNRLAWAAHANRRTAHAFDSFAGMASPGPFDGEEYPAGALACNVDDFLGRLTAPRESFEIWPGYAPGCFRGFSRPLAFAYVDLDHHGPTAYAIGALWPLIQPGGILAFDDYFPGRGKLATPAIERFLLWARSGRQVGAERTNRNDQLFVTRYAPRP